MTTMFDFCPNCGRREIPCGCSAAQACRWCLRSHHPKIKCEAKARGIEKIARDALAKAQDEQEKTMTQPTEQQLKDPTWWERAAPPWAKTIIRAKDNRDLWWFEHHVGRGTAMNLRSGQQITADNTGFAYAWEIVVIRPEPQSQEWDGKSWPIPVGVTVKNWCGEHRTVIVHDGENIVCRCDDSGGYRGYSKGQATAHKLQPLRTKEQRDREEAIEAALSIDNYPMGRTAGGMMSRKDFCAALYDAGMLRKGGE